MLASHDLVIAKTVVNEYTDIIFSQIVMQEGYLVIISLITEPSSRLPEKTGQGLGYFLPLAVCISVNLLGFIPVQDQGSTLYVVHRNYAKQSMHILQLAGTRSSFKSIFLVRNPHRAFSLPSVHSMGFLAERYMLLKPTCALVLHVSYSFRQCGVNTTECLRQTKHDFKF